MSQATQPKVSVASRVAHDSTGQTDYDRLVSEEIEHYSEIELKDDLTEGGVHGHAAWSYNYEYLYRNVFHTNFWDEVAACANEKTNPSLLSLGCGYGGVDLRVARLLAKPNQILAVDLNPNIFDDARERARIENLNLQFACFDLNFIELEPGSFDIIYAFASIHHILNLEHLLDQVHHALKPGGRVVLLDIIGKTQVMHWRENVEFAARLLRNLPHAIRPGSPNRLLERFRPFNAYSVIDRYVDPGQQIGMEGIRQEEIEPLLEQRFKPIKKFRYNAFMRLICTNPVLGACLNPHRNEDRQFLEHLIEQDQAAIQSGLLRPTELFGVYEAR